MVRDYARNLARQLPTLMPIQQINQAMVVFGHQNRHTLPHIRPRQSPLHREFLRDVIELSVEVTEWKIEPGWVELDTHKKCVRVVIAMLIRMQNVPTMLGDESRNRRNNPLAIRAAEKEYGRILHPENLSLGP